MADFEHFVKGLGPHAKHYTPEQLKQLHVSQVVESFLRAASGQRTLNGESVRKYREAIHYFVRTLGDALVRDITPATLVEFQCGRSEANVGPSHINGVVYAVKRLVEYCRSLGMDVADLSSIRPLTVPRRTVGYLTEGEFDQLVSAIGIHRRNGEVNSHAFCFRALVEVLAGSGMRLSEALALDRQGIRWNDQEAKIVGKGGKERTVFFTDRALRWLRRYIESRIDRNPAIFVTGLTKKRLTRHEAERLCRKYVARARLVKRVTLHTLRHTYATTLLRNGCPIGHIKGLLGHERLETTCRFYLGVMQDSELKQAHRRFLDLST